MFVKYSVVSITRLCSKIYFLKMLKPEQKIKLCCPYRLVFLTPDLHDLFLYKDSSKAIFICDCRISLTDLKFYIVGDQRCALFLSDKLVYPVALVCLVLCLEDTRTLTRAFALFVRFLLRDNPIYLCLQSRLTHTDSCFVNALL